MEGRKVVYDCGNLKYINSKRLVCKQGRKLSLAKDGGMDVKLLLKGEASKTCQDCTLYVKGELLCT